MGAQALGAVPAQDEPELEGPEPPAQRDMPVAVVDDRAGFGGRVAQVLGQHGEGLDQLGPVGDPEGVAVEPGEKPLVRVEAVGVGQLHAGMGPAQFGADRGGPGVGGVDVQPHAVSRQI